MAKCHHLVTILLVYVIVLFVLLGSPSYVTAFDVFDDLTFSNCIRYAVVILNIDNACMAWLHSDTAFFPLSL